MRLVYGAAGALLLAVGACSKRSHTERPSAARTEGEQSREHDASDTADSSTAPGQPETIERKAGTYDPLRDRAPHTGPGAPHTGDVPGTGLEPLDHPPPTPPRPIPAPPLGVPSNTPTPPPQ